MARIDLNADVGEGFGRWALGDDDALLGVVTSANVACGFHAGDPTIMRHVCGLAAANDVAIGAQVSYPDLGGFGRRFMDIEPAELTDAVLYQIGALDGFARLFGTAVRYVKPHGALYNATVSHAAQAAAVVQAVREDGRGLAIVGLPGSQLLLQAAEAGVATVREAFADRAYAADGTLLSRRAPGAVLDDPDVVAERAERMAVEGVVTAVDGTIVDVAADTICVHGDTPGAASLAARVRRALESAGVAVCCAVP